MYVSWCATGIPQLESIVLNKCGAHLPLPQKTLEFRFPSCSGRFTANNNILSTKTSLHKPFLFVPVYVYTQQRRNKSRRRRWLHNNQD